MRLLLGLLNEDLADRFYIPPIHCSNLFKTWIQFLCKTAGKLVTWLPKKSVMETMQKSFKTTVHEILQWLVDCSELFTERAKKN